MNSLVGLGACTMIACAARFLWGWEIKKDRAMGFLVCCLHEKVGKSQKKEREGGRERKHLQKDPWIWKPPIQPSMPECETQISCCHWLSSKRKRTFMGMEISWWIGATNAGFVIAISKLNMLITLCFYRKSFQSILKEELQGWSFNTNLTKKLELGW